METHRHITITSGTTKDTSCYTADAPEHGSSDLSLRSHRPDHQKANGKLVEEVCPDLDCLQPMQRCSGCQAANRTTARYCRRCKAKLAFHKNVAGMLAGVRFSQQSLLQNSQHVSLPGTPVGMLTAIAAGWGYLVFASKHGGIGVMTNTSENPLRMTNRFRIQDGDKISHFHRINRGDGIPGFFAIGRRSIFRISLIPQVNCRCLFSFIDPNWQIDDTIVSGTSLIIRLFHQASWWYRWLVIDDVAGTESSLSLQKRGPVSPMLQLTDEGKFFFHTAYEGILYDLKKKEETRYLPPSGGLNISVAPKQHNGTGDIILHALDGLLYHIKINKNIKELRPFNDVPRDIVQLFANENEDNSIYAFDHNNFFAFDSISGEEQWNFGKEFGELFICGVQPSQQFGTYMIVPYRNRTWQQERIVLFAFKDRGDLLVLPSSVSAYPAPVCGSSHLISVLNPSNESGREQKTLSLFKL